MRRNLLLALLSFGLTLVAACGLGGLMDRGPTATLAPPTAPPAPPATRTPVSAPPEQIATAFFQAWQSRHYDRLYGLLTSAAKARITQDELVRRYSNIEGGIGVTRTVVVAQTPIATPDGGSVRVPYSVTRSVPIFGELKEVGDLPLIRIDGQWGVDWTPAQVFSGLTEGSTVRLIQAPAKRGRILDRGGLALADTGTVVTINVVPAQIKDEPALIAAISEALGMDQAAIKKMYQGGQPDWLMPIARRSSSDKPSLLGKLGAVAGVVLQDTPARVYPLGGAAAHLVGYLTHPSADELQALSPAGYDDSDWIGRTGIEAWAEKDLAGQKGGRISIIDSGDQPVRTIAQRDAVVGSDVLLAIDSKLQVAASSVLGDKTGSVVLLDPRDNSVLALASQPTFDPNQFIVGLSDEQWQLLNGPTTPLVFRAAESAYPTGSTFKVITMTAGMEKGGFTVKDTFDCGLNWNGLPGVTLHNWQAEGTLDLVEALTESCNPAFFTIGLKLDHQDPMILPSFARLFGLGKITGTVGLADVPGVVPDPEWKQRTLGEAWSSGDSVNLAIGQGYLLVTPIQLANAYSALAHGGTLRTPVLVKAVVHPDGTRKTYAADERGKIPAGPGTLAAILAGMRRVTSTPAGTASYAFRDERTAVAAKTGSAENENPDAHAWFAGFMTPDRPTVLAIVMIEGGQHGGTVAAPIAREILDTAYPLNK